MINKCPLLALTVVTFFFSTIALSEPTSEVYCSTNLRHECDKHRCETLSQSVSGAYSFYKKTLLLEACLGSTCHSGKAKLHKIDGKLIAVAKVKSKDGHSELLVSLRIFQDNTFIATWTGNEDTRIDTGSCEKK